MRKKSITGSCTQLPASADNLNKSVAGMSTVSLKQANQELVSFQDSMNLLDQALQDLENVINMWDELYDQYGRPGLLTCKPVGKAENLTCVREEKVQVATEPICMSNLQAENQSHDSSSTTLGSEVVLDTCDPENTEYRLEIDLLRKSDVLNNNQVTVDKICMANQKLAAITEVSNETYGSGSKFEIHEVESHILGVNQVIFYTSTLYIKQLGL